MIPIINLTIKTMAQHGVAISTLNNHRSIYLKLNLHVNGFLCYKIKKNTVSKLLRLSYNAKITSNYC